jgi:Lrp/AsnC family transcriptional regulator, leucine-responsive regulatory protein
MATELTEKDNQLLALLRQNARRPVSEVAAILGVTRQTVQKRLDRLVENGAIRRFTIELSEGIEAAPAVSFKIAFILNLRQSACSRVFATIRHWPELVHCWSIAGDWDMIAIFEFTNPDSTEAARAKLARHPDVIAVKTTHILKNWR